MTPFSRWERELPRLVQDPRFQAVPTLRERRLLFDDYCKLVAEEHKKAKGGGKKAAAEAFAALLNEIAAGAGMSHSASNQCMFFPCFLYTPPPPGTFQEPSFLVLV